MPDVAAFFHQRREMDGLGRYDSDEQARNFWREYYLEAFRRLHLEHEEEIRRGWRCV